MKIFETSQIKEIDNYTVENEPIDSFELMERAAGAFCDEILPFLNNRQQISVFAGPGDNGGDALVIARLLLMANESVRVFLINPQNRLSQNCEKAKIKLLASFPDSINEVIIPEEINISSTGYVIDGLFGSGLNRPLEGIFAKIVSIINNSGATIFSIDIPSGLFGEDNSYNNKNTIIKADYTFSFQLPKIAFFLYENEQFVGKYSILDIGLHPQALLDFPSKYYFIDENYVKSILRPRRKFSHKGVYGHALLIAGSLGKTGAAVLAAKACMRTGCGLLTTFIPNEGYEIMQISVPEAMVEINADEREINCLTELLKENKYNAIGIGPGVGVGNEAKNNLLCLLTHCKAPLVIDADALNIISLSPEILQAIPENSVLTPHPKEFDRLAGYSSSGYERLRKQMAFSEKYKVIVVLKGAYTSIAFPDGRCFFNSTGNPGMATGGSGDVLTGIILSLLAQKYSPEEAALLGVYIHGSAGDFASEEFSQQSMIAGDIIRSLGKAFLKLSK